MTIHITGFWAGVIVGIVASFGGSFAVMAYLYHKATKSED